MFNKSRQLFAPYLMVHFLLAAFLSPTAAIAAQTNNMFSVVVRLNTGNPLINQSAFCRKTSGKNNFGAIYTIVCSTGELVDISNIGNGAPWKPTHGGAYRFITQFPTASDPYNTINNHGVGTVSSWRTINLQDRDYLELLIGW